MDLDDVPIGVGEEHLVPSRDGPLAVGSEFRRSDA